MGFVSIMLGCLFVIGDGVGVIVGFDRKELAISVWPNFIPSNILFGWVGCGGACLAWGGVGAGCVDSNEFDGVVSFDANRSLLLIKPPL